MTEFTSGTCPGASGPGWKTTLRISGIPAATTKEGLCQILEGLAVCRNTTRDDTTNNTKRRREDNVLAISLAPSPSTSDSHIYKVAAVTFKEIPCDITYPGRFRMGPAEAEFEVDIDTHFRGLTPLNYSLNPSVDIIAVTGLAGHAFGSWGSRKDHTMWLRDLLPDDLERDGLSARIFTYGYDTTLAGSMSNALVTDYSRLFLEAVKDSRPQQQNTDRPIIFVGHSFGGLIIKDALIEAHSDYNYLFRLCYGILLLGVPNKGLENSNLMAMVQGQPNSALVHDLSVNSQFLGLLDRSFCQSLKGLDTKVISFYELQNTRTVKEVAPGKWERAGEYVHMVTRESAISPLSKTSEVYPLDADHSTMVKFDYRSDENYINVRGKIIELTKAAPDAVRQRLAEQREREKKCLQSLVPDNNDPTLKVPREISHPRTCHWILTDGKFKNWCSQESASKLLRISGNPGTGKTVITSFLLNKLKETSTVVYFFCNDKDEGQRTATAAIKSLIYQFLCGNESLFKHIMPEFEQFRDTQPKVWSVDTLWKVFCSIACDAEASLVYCLIDALDECEETSRNDLLSRMTELYAPDSGCQVRLMVSSRPYADIQDRLKRFDMIPLGQESTRNDISRFIAEKLRESFSNRGFPNELRNRVEYRLCKEAKGMFLWVSLVIKDLSRCFSEAEVDARLESLPRDLYGYYDNILGRIREEEVDRAKQMLMWIVNATRPMTLKELNTALAISTAISGASKPPSTTETPTALQLDSIQKYRSSDIRRELEARCGLLVEVQCGNHDSLSLGDGGDDCTVHLIHQSVKEFFTIKSDFITELVHHSRFYIPPQNAHRFLGGICVIYPSFQDFKLIRIPERDSFFDQFSPAASLPLTDYCVKNWLYHLQKSETLGSTVQNALLKFQTSHATQFGLWAEYWLPIHAASSLGIHSLASFLLRNGADVNQRDMAGLIPLNLAIMGSHEKMVRILVNSGADVNLNDAKGMAPLYYAITNGNEAALRILMEAGANINLQDAKGKTPLHYAIKYGHTIARILVEAGADINLQDSKEKTALHSASIRGNKVAAKILVEAGANVNLQDAQGKTQLHYAIKYGHAISYRHAIARILVEAGADVNLQDAKGRTAFRSVVIHGNIAAVEALVEAGANVNLQDAKGETPLHHAIMWTDEALVKILVEAGANINLQDAQGKTPLHHAIKYGHAAREYGSQDLGGSQSGYQPTTCPGVTPPHYPVEYGHAIVMILVEAGAGVNLQDAMGRTALHSAAIYGNMATVKALVGAGVNVNSQDGEGETPLHLAVRKRRKNMARCLVALGVDVNSTNSVGGTPFSEMVSRGGEWEEISDRRRCY